MGGLFCVLRGVPAAAAEEAKAEEAPSMLPPSPLLAPPPLAAFALSLSHAMRALVTAAEISSLFFEVARSRAAWRAAA